MAGNVTTQKICALADLVEAEPRRFEVEGHGVAVVRLGDDVHVIGDRCSHQNVSLSEGEVDPDTKMIECWKHGSMFSLTDGHPDSLPATQPVPVYTAVVRDGDVHVEVQG